MQKVLRRTALAKNQAIRRAKLREKDKRYNERLAKRDDQREKGAARAEILRKARQTNREDWVLGPLAPRRGVGEEKDTYGTMPLRLLQHRDVPEKNRMRYWNIVEGDRVVILHGRDKGKIGEVVDASEERETITVRNMNLVDVSLPEWLRNSGDPRPIHTIPMPLKPSQVRLVYPLVDPETGVHRDVIIERLTTLPYWDARTGKWRHERVIPGLNISIPFPERYEAPEVDHDDDTLRISVEENTWVPTLLSPPMPMSVIDELRNKYSVFRTRHEPQYIAKKVQEEIDAENLKRKQLEIQFPMRPKHIFAPKQKEEPQLTEAMLAKIGEIMATKTSLGEQSKQASFASNSRSSTQPNRGQSPNPVPPDQASSSTSSTYL